MTSVSESTSRLGEVVSNLTPSIPDVRGQVGQAIDGAMENLDPALYIRAAQFQLKQGIDDLAKSVRSAGLYLGAGLAAGGFFIAVGVVVAAMLPVMAAEDAKLRQEETTRGDTRR